MRTPSQTFTQRLGHSNATPHHNNIYIFRGTLQKNVADISAHHITFQSQHIGCLRDLSENGFTEMLLQFLLSQLYHLHFSFLQ